MSTQASAIKPLEFISDFEYEFEIWLLQQSIREITATGYRPAIINYLHHCGSDLPTRENFITWCRQKSAILSDLTLFSWARTIRRFFIWCLRTGRYQDVTAEIKLPGRNLNQFRRGSLSLQQVAQLLNTVREKGDPCGRDFAMLHLMISCGLRRVEVVRANVGDLGRVRDRNCLRIQGKGHSVPDDLVILSDHLYQVLIHYLDSRPSGRGSGKIPLFQTIQAGRNVRLCPQMVTYIVRRWLDQAGIVGFNLCAHSLRHTAAVLALEGGADIFSVSRMLRHTDISVTRLYLNSADRFKRPAEDFIQLDFFDPLSGGPK